jgi:hypothetical protein
MRSFQAPTRFLCLLRCGPVEQVMSLGFAGPTEPATGRMTFPFGWLAIKDVRNDRVGAPTAPNRGAIRR